MVTDRERAEVNGAAAALKRAQKALGGVVRLHGLLCLKMRGQSLGSCAVYTS